MISTTDGKYYNRLNNNNALMKPLKTEEIISGQYYEIEAPRTGERLFYKCLRSGKVMIKYGVINGRDTFLFTGEGVLSPDHDLTYGFNEGI